MEVSEKTKIIYEILSYNFPKAVIQLIVVAPNSRNMKLLAKGQFSAHS